MSASQEEPASRVAFLWWRTYALGVAQIVSWGTLFYTIAVLGAAMRRDTGVGELWLFGSFTAGLFVSGVVSPAIGREIDARGGRRVLAAGSVLAAVACAALATAQGPLTVLLGWLLAGVAMSACLYDPAFATLHQIAGTSYRRAVTALTLFGGLASTVFWPLSQLLLDAHGWRMTFAVYAALHVVLCLPIHLTSLPAARVVPSAPPAETTTPVAQGGAAFVWLATALALAGFIASAVAAHFVGLLTATGMSARDAVLVGSLIGPMQVAGRILEFAFNRRVRALVVGGFAFALLAGALAVLTQVRGILLVALAFAMLYGCANGIMTIVRGTAPAELFGHRDYGALLGRLALPQFVMRAIAPFALALLFLVDPSRSLSPLALLLLGLCAAAAYGVAVRVTRHR